MPATYPSISALTVTPGFGQNFLKSTYADPNAGGGLPGLSLDLIEYWVAASNDRDAASLAVEGLGDVQHFTGDGEERWYWSRPRIREIGPTGERFYGDWFPVSPTGGIAVAATAEIDDNGFIQFPNGAIEQWGMGETDTAGVGTVIFPLEFPARVLNVTAVPRKGLFEGITHGRIVDIVVPPTGLDNEGFLLVMQEVAADGTLSAANAQNFFWRAIGF